VSNTTRLAGPGRTVQPQLEICGDHIHSGPVERLVAFNKTISFLDAAAQLGMQIGAAEAVRFSLDWLLELQFEATTFARFSSRPPRSDPFFHQLAYARSANFRAANPRVRDATREPNKPMKKLLLTLSLALTAIPAMAGGWSGY
jgi:hypothetical protein